MQKDCAAAEKLKAVAGFDGAGPEFIKDPDITPFASTMNRVISHRKS
jgi:hypothetical protein